MVSGDSVIVGDGDRMVAFDAGTRAWRWQAAAWTFGLTATGQPAAAYADDPTGSGIVAIDARTGRQRWTAPVSGGQHSWGSVVAGADAVAVVDGSSLVVLDASSDAVRWRAEVGSGHTFRPVIAGDTVLATGAGTPAIRAFDLGSGQPLWTVPRANARFAGTDGNTVYIGGAPLQYGIGGPGTSEIRALNLRTGRQHWLEYGGEEIIGAPMVGNGAIYAVWGSAVHALDPATGKKRADYALNVTESGLTVVGSMAYLYVGYGKVVAIEI